MITLVMRDKSLTCTFTGQIYQYDNNADQIKCLIPTIYEGNSLKDVNVILCFKDETGNGGFIELTLSEDLFNDNYYQYLNKINPTLTKHTGKLTVWLKISDYENDFSFETGETSFTILPSKEMPKANNLPQSSYFDQWLTKMTQIQNATLKTQRDAINILNSTRNEIENIKNRINQLEGGEDDVN